MTSEDVKEFLRNRDFEDTIVFENYDYADAFVGVSYDGNAVYDYDKMVEYLMEKGLEEVDAIEWLEYNTIRAISYMTGGKKPIIIYDRI